MNENNLIAFSNCLSDSMAEADVSDTVLFTNSDVEVLYYINELLFRTELRTSPFDEAGALSVIASAADKFARKKWQEACEATRESMINESGVMPEYR